MITDAQFTRRMLQTVFAVAGVVVLCATLWTARAALLIIYVSALVAMGFSPIVRVIERQRKDGRRRGPRWLAILLLYGVLVGILVIIGLMIIPPLVTQASALWDRLPDEFNRFQRSLIRYKLLRREV